MHDDGHAAQRAAEHDGHADKTALGEDDVGLELADDAKGLHGASDYPERVGEVAQIKVTAQFAGLHSVIGHTVHRLDERAFDAVLGADVVDLPSIFQQVRNQRLVGGDVAGRAATG